MIILLLGLLLNDIDKLGSESFEERHQATVRLSCYREISAPALIVASFSSDLERSYRANLLLSPLKEKWLDYLVTVQTFKFLYAKWQYSYYQEVYDLPVWFHYRMVQKTKNWNIIPKNKTTEIELFPTVKYSKYGWISDARLKLKKK